MEIFEILLSLTALIILEVVLGIDNLVFLSILSEKLPAHQRKKARKLGLTLAWVMRLLLLASAFAIVKLNNPFVYLFGYGISWRDVFLFVGGGFLITKATQEIHYQVITTEEMHQEIKPKTASFWPIITQIGVMDIIFSLDSVLTAVGLTNRFWIMAVAITIAIIVMVFLSEPVSYFIEKFPSLKVLALSFLILIGMVLIADSFNFHIPRGYIYFAMGFSLGVETINLLMRAKQMRAQKRK